MLANGHGSDVQCHDVVQLCSVTELTDLLVGMGVVDTDSPWQGEMRKPRVSVDTENS